MLNVSDSLVVFCTMAARPRRGRRESTMPPRFRVRPACAGTPPKIIEEFLSAQTAEAQHRRMSSPPGWGAWPNPRNLTSIPSFGHPAGRFTSGTMTCKLMAGAAAGSTATRRAEYISFASRVLTQTPCIAMPPDQIIQKAKPCRRHCKFSTIRTRHPVRRWRWTSKGWSRTATIRGTTKRSVE